ncbi:MAG: hypothetical protein KatS3mg022_0451 [Armatimonadota bacterium]|nr:MAG: hypothetical protein KatS3mg022_0451 [Armatimonadota bacterium]
MNVLFVLLPALAMCLGWGIRGQFGGETGAMVPGAMVGLALAMLAGWRGKEAVRLAAVAAFACSLGGMMTYGQTIGLVQNQYPSPTYWWGLLGLAIKGGVWIGIVGAFLAIAASDRYRPQELALMLLGMLALWAIGVQLLNRPHNPPEQLPLIYFSDPNSAKPRVEWWGGLWSALIGLMVYTGAFRKHRQAVAMALGGIVAGAIGFSFGEVLQAWGMHQKPFGEAVQRWMDWWKVMEMTFGFIAGAGLGIGWKMSGLSANLPPQPATWHRRWDDLTILLWLIPTLAVEQDVSWAQSWANLPFLWMLFGLLGSLAGTGWAPFGTGVAVTLVSATDTVRYLTDEKALFAGGWGFAGLVVLLFITAYLAALWFRRNAPTRTWWLWTVWMQTGLTWVKFLPPVLFTPGEGNWFVRWGSGGVVEISFLVLAVVLTLLAPRREEG